MSFFEQFKNFDPLQGYVAEYPFSFLPDIAFRARSILLGKTHEQLVAMAHRIDREINGFFADQRDIAILVLKDKLIGSDDFLAFFEWDGGTEKNGRWQFKEEMLEELDIPTENNCSEFDALKTIIEERDEYFFLPAGAPTPPKAEFAEGRDQELFATLALWLLSDCLRMSRKDGKIELSIAGELAIKAMEAVCYAEYLKEVEWLERFHQKEIEAAKNPVDAEKIRKEIIEETKIKEQKKRSEQSQILNKHRHRASHNAKKAVLEEWEKDITRFPSAEKAGAYFADWIEERKLLKSVAPRTVTKWIREYAKSRGIQFR